MQARYQYGTLTKRTRRKGPDVWQWRYSEQGRVKAVLIGTVEKYPSKSDAERAVENLRIRINQQNSQTFHSVTVAALIDRYLREEMPERVRKDTAGTYRGILKNWIMPKWGPLVLHDVKTLAVESWLRGITRAANTKAHIRNIMHLLFNCAIRWELTDRNPINLVRQSTKRARIPRVLTAGEFGALRAELREPYRTMVTVAGCLGLRISEILGLQWRDVDWGNLSILIQRSVVEGKVYETKTEASRKPMPIDPKIAEALLMVRRSSAYTNPDDFIFAGSSGKPRWNGIMLTDHIKPAALRAGIGKIGWHTFRHTFSSLLHQAGTKLAVQKELLRHADISTTMNIYTQAVSDDKREAVHRVVHALLNA
ncbi:MAG TPA: site-specific integrase [Terriglobia bacterium]|nr:site-specific integrase [Terriglobia bacterium]